MLFTVIRVAIIVALIVFVVVVAHKKNIKF